jgi:hypothetical protein
VWRSRPQHLQCPRILSLGRKMPDQATTPLGLPVQQKCNRGERNGAFWGVAVRKLRDGKRLQYRTFQ